MPNDPAAKTARGRGKISRRKLIATAPWLAAGIAQAGPTGSQVTGGSGAITQSWSATTIQEASQNLSLNWKTFNVATTRDGGFCEDGLIHAGMSNRLAMCRHLSSEYGQ